MKYFEIKPLPEDIDEDKIFKTESDAESWVDWCQSFDDCHPGHCVIKWEDKFYVIFRKGMWDDIYYESTEY